MAVVVRTNGDIVTVVPGNGLDFSFDEIKFLIRVPRTQNLEIVPLLKDQQILVCNEDPHQGGSFRPNNIVNLKYKDQFNGTVLGDVLICDIDQVK